MKVQVHLHFKFAHMQKLSCSVRVDMMDPSLSNSVPMDLLNAIVDHDRQGQAAHNDSGELNKHNGNTMINGELNKHNGNTMIVGN